VPLSRRLWAEFFGTFWLVFGGYGSAVLAAAFPGLGIGFAGVALAFGLAVLTMAYAVGHVSGAHFNPAVSFGLWAGKRFAGKDLLPYIVAEVVLTFFFLFVILGATDKRAPAGFAPIAIGLALTLIHLISIPVTNTSVNPARSTGPAIFAGGWALSQLWLFWVAPIVGGILAGFVYPRVTGEKTGAQ
jgi:aquaporin Z